MKLLTPQETSAQKATEQSRELLRIEQIRETLKKETQKLNELNALFDKRLNEQRKQWADEELKSLQELERLQQLIKEYELKERTFFFPIAALEKKTHDNYERSKMLEAEATQKQKVCDELEELLHTKLDEVSEQSQDLDRREEKIKINEQGIRDQQIQTKNLSQALAMEWQKFHAQVKEFEIFSLKEKQVIELAQQNISDRESKLIEEQEELKNEKKRLVDGRQTLARAWEELERKKQK